MPAADDFTEAVIEVLKSTQPGEVMAYGEVALEAGYPGAARAVGNLLRTVPGLPWWRVVNAAGRLAPGAEQEQAQRLRTEGVAVVDGRVKRTKSRK
jgi:methylated-DNA-protein-cysteine methyltransferase-like protein